MKIAITSTGPGLDSTVDSRFGRAKMFVIYDTESESAEAVDNSQNLNAAQGAGIQAGENVSRTGAEAVITGHCGPKAFRTLAAAGISVYNGAAGTVSDAIKMFNDGKLQKADAADVDGHWM